MQTQPLHWSFPAVTMVRRSPAKSPSSPALRHKAVFPFLFSWEAVVLGVCLYAAYFISFHYFKPTIESAARSRFESRAANVDFILRKHIRLYTALLYNIRGFFDASYDVERGEWAKYFHEMELSNLYPGVSQIAFVRTVSPKHWKAYSRAIEADAALADLHYPAWPEMAASIDRTAYVIDYLAPVEGVAFPFGMNVGKDPEIRDLLARARKSDRPVTGTLIDFNGGEPAENGFVYMALPVMKSASKWSDSGDEGFIVAAIKVHDLLSDLFDKDYRNYDLHIEIFDGKDLYHDTLIFDTNSEPISNEVADWQYRRELIFGERLWTLRILPMDGTAFSMLSAQSLPNVLFIFIAVVASFASLFIRYLRRTKQIQVEINRRVSEELQRSQMKFMGAFNELKLSRENVLAKSRELERSNHDLEQFAYLASHDLQEPLRMVASFTELLSQRYADRLDAQAGEFVGFIVDGVKRMQDLIKDLLMYSRAGSGTAKPAELDLTTSVAAALSNLEVALKESGAVVEYGELPTVMACDSQMALLFQNLISNALKYRSKEAPQVTVSACRGDKEWILTVKDNGIGIEERYYERIFDIFQRLHPRHEYSGTGVGLAICKKIVERQGGRIWVESKLGQGSQFHFSIPDGDGA